MSRDPDSSVAQLIEAAMVHHDEDLSREHVQAIQKMQHSESCSKYILALTASLDNRARYVAYWVLGGVVNVNDIYLIGTSLVNALQRENVALNLGRAIRSLGQLLDSSSLTQEITSYWLSEILSHQSHCDPGVRLSVAQALFGHESSVAIAALVRLSNDKSSEVRDWATFALAMADSDDLLIRSAFRQRLSDSCSDARAEALYGLALRKDRCVFTPLLKELESTEVSTLVVEAAKELADVRLLDSLRKLSTWWDVDEELLSEAIAKCSRIQRG